MRFLLLITRHTFSASLLSVACAPHFVAVAKAQRWSTKMAAPAITFDVLLGGLLNKANEVRKSAEKYYLDIIATPAGLVTVRGAHFKLPAPHDR